MQSTNLICGVAPLAYKQRLDKLSLKFLNQRQFDVIKKFAMKMSADDRFSDLFPRRDGPLTRNKKIYREPYCKTKRYLTSPLVTFLKILNEDIHMLN